jgi:hypothetical protein
MKSRSEVNGEIAEVERQVRGRIKVADVRSGPQFCDIDRSGAV